MFRQNAILAMAVGVPLAAASAFGQAAGWDPLHPRPLNQLRLFLENQFEKTVTYEDPVWRWVADSVAVGSEPEGPMGRLLWERRLVLPAGVTRQENATLDMHLVEHIIDAYHRQNPGDTRFKVIESSLGLHIVPSFVHDEDGILVAATSLLDTRITVPRAARMPSEHFQAICAAIARTSGIRVDLADPWLDSVFAPNQAVPGRGGAARLSAKEKTPYSFEWGASGVPAREAMIELSAASNSTLSWGLLCQPTLKPQDRWCTLNVVALVVTRPGLDGKPEKVYRTYDRCGKCEFLKRSGQ